MHRQHNEGWLGLPLLIINMNSLHAYKFKSIRQQLGTIRQAIKRSGRRADLDNSTHSVPEEDLSPWDTSSMGLRPIALPSVETLHAKTANSHMNELMSTWHSRMNNTRLTREGFKCVSPSNNNFDARVILLPEGKKGRSLSPNRPSKLSNTIPTNRRPGQLSNTDLGVLLHRRPSLRTRMREFFAQDRMVTRPIEERSQDSKGRVNPVPYPIMLTPKPRKLSVRQSRQLKKAKFMNNYTRNVDPQP